jgi:hypothetical protein
MKVREELLPFRAMVVLPVELVEAVHSCVGSYCTLNCGVDWEVMVWEPEFTMPPASKFPELSTLKRVVPEFVL